MKRSITSNCKKKKEENTFSVRGYAPVRRLVESGNRYTRSCYNCEYFYQAPGDDEEVCQNSNVNQFDMVISEISIYCNQWVLSARRTDAKTLCSKGKHK